MKRRERIAEAVRIVTAAIEAEEPLLVHFPGPAWANPKLWEEVEAMFKVACAVDPTLEKRVNAIPF